MNNLFFGGSSNIALKLSNKLKNTDAISTKKVVNSYRKFFKIENYTSTNLNKLEKRFDRKYENILIFNGLYSSSFLSIFDNKTFMRDFEINFLIPMKISNFILQKNLLKKNGAIYFISSIAAHEDLIGNANYSISKNALNFSAKILSNEQKKRGLRINTITLGLIKNKMGIQVKKITNTKKKFQSINEVINQIRNILKNKKINKKNIKIL